MGQRLASRTLRCTEVMSMFRCWRWRGAGAGGCGGAGLGRIDLGGVMKIGASVPDPPGAVAHRGTIICSVAASVGVGVVEIVVGASGSSALPDADVVEAGFSTQWQAQGSPLSRPGPASSSVSHPDRKQTTPPPLPVTRGQRRYWTLHLYVKSKHHPVTVVGSRTTATVAMVRLLKTRAIGTHA
uniref:Uncharacterized protein n=1 Tax=Arundo donax TaxID=35708 RepID=A0A0A9BE01_ARUDO